MTWIMTRMKGKGTDLQRESKEPGRKECQEVGLGLHTVGIIKPSDRADPLHCRLIEVVAVADLLISVVRRVTQVSWVFLICRRRN